MSFNHQVKYRGCIQVAHFQPSQHQPRPGLIEVSHVSLLPPDKFMLLCRPWTLRGRPHMTTRPRRAPTCARTPLTITSTPNRAGIPPRSRRLCLPRGANPSPHPGVQLVEWLTLEGRSISSFRRPPPVASDATGIGLARSIWFYSTGGADACPGLPPALPFLKRVH